MKNFTAVKLIILALFMLLSACSTTKKDGPPNYYVDETKIPDAVPKVEQPSKYGNYSTYRVFGKSYHVMKSSKNYEERGVASWYGTAFHAQRTSSGERYNMLAMTAAHKTLPLPTYVQVTNLKNGRKIIVKVNDRGPFESNRLIDLSYVAAKKLGMLGRGTAYVDVKAIDPLRYDRNESHYSDIRVAKNNVATVPVKTHHSIQGVYLQVGAFKNKVYAEQLKKKLTPLVSSPIRVAHSARLYQVQIGPFKDIASAKLATRRLRSASISKTQKWHFQTEV